MTLTCTETIRNHAAFIWSVADLLRGDYKQSEYGRVILPLGAWGPWERGVGVPLAMCPLCTDDEGIELIRTLDNARTVVRHRCGYEWEHGEPTAPRRCAAFSFKDLKSRFAKPEDFDPEVAGLREPVEGGVPAKPDFDPEVAGLREPVEGGVPAKPDFDPEVAAYWAKYQQIFSREGLWACDPQQLKDFANSETGARPGSMSSTTCPAGARRASDAIT